MAARKSTNEPTYKFILNSEVTLSVRRMKTVDAVKPRLGQVQPEFTARETQWEYAIFVAGKKMALFAGTDFYTSAGASVWEAAVTALWYHMPTADYSIPDWFRTEEMSTPQFRWFLDTARKLQEAVFAADMIGQIPGVYMVDEEGNETHFRADGWPERPIDVGDVSEGTQELIEAQMDYTDPENEAPVTYPNLSTSPFSG